MAYPCPQYLSISCLYYAHTHFFSVQQLLLLHIIIICREQIYIFIPLLIMGYSLRLTALHITPACAFSAHKKKIQGEHKDNLKMYAWEEEKDTDCSLSVHISLSFAIQCSHCFFLLACRLTSYKIVAERYKTLLKWALMIIWLNVGMIGSSCEKRLLSFLSTHIASWLIWAWRFFFVCIYL